MSEDPPAVEVLFEYSSSRVAVSTPLTTLNEALETQLLKFGVVGTVKLSTECGAQDQNVLLIQRFDDKWKAFVNVDEYSQITNGDRITVVPKPKMESVAGSSDRVGTLLGKLGTPVGPRASSLKRLFASSASAPS